MSGPFDHLLDVAPDVVEREMRIARYLERAQRLFDLAEECRKNEEAALEAADAYEKLAGRLLLVPGPVAPVI